MSPVVRMKGEVRSRVYLILNGTHDLLDDIKAVKLQAQSHLKALLAYSRTVLSPISTSPASSSVAPKTPVAGPSTRSFSRSPAASGSKVQRTVRKLFGPREWSKDDWKLLDSCYTDERLALTRSPEALAPIDKINLEKVVDRFSTAVGGQDLVKNFGPAWTR